jgi:inner membrane protein
MDSLTQLTLGASVGEIVLGKKIGNRAVVWGAVAGSFPDLDIVIAPFTDDIGFIVHHRAISHSLLLPVIASPILGWLLAKWYRNHPAGLDYRHWTRLFFWCLLTHLILDVLTVYGTQILLPFSDYRAAIGSIFIIDPLYTIPLLAGVAASLFLKPTSAVRRTVNYAGIVASSCYLLLTLCNKCYVEQVFSRSLTKQNITANRFMTNPTPLNNVLWYCIAEDTDGYHLGYYSLLDRSRDVEFTYIPRHAEPITDFEDAYVIDRLIWFSDGYYAVRKEQGELVFHNIKFGNMTLNKTEERFVFSYLIESGDEGGLSARQVFRAEGEDLMKLARGLWQRIKGI